MITCFIGWFNEMLIEGNGRSILFRGSKQNHTWRFRQFSQYHSQDVTICCAVLVSLHHALTHCTSRLFIVLSDMSSGVLLEISSLWILMLCFTILSRSDNQTNLLIEALINWSGAFDMCERLLLPK